MSTFSLHDKSFEELRPECWKLNVFCAATVCRHTSSDKLTPSDKRVERPAIERVPSPAYSETYGHVDFSQSGLDTEARVARMTSYNLTLSVTNLA